MHDPNLNAPPFNPLPPVVILLSLAIMAPELVLQAGERGFIGGATALGWRLDAITNFGFYDTVWSWMIETQRFPAEHLMRFITYPFIHGNFTHALFTLVFTLAIGKMVAEVFSTWAVLVIFFASSVLGALAYGVLLDSSLPLIGAYPAVYGLIGGLTFVLKMRYQAEGDNPLRAFSLIGFLLGIQLVFKVLFGGGDDWIADIVGFITGFLLSYVFAPDGPERMQSWLNTLRRRR